ncbi:MAG TPA: DUF4167 domain-containing protein [Methylocystis sp.]|nr:DUF4167 domain-containing protein [Methylocystis sp.]
MRPGQNKRLRGRNGRKGPNPLTRSFESNGPDVKIRGTAQHVAEKYLQLARDAQSSGDIVLAENLLQHAEHYFRLISAAQQQQSSGYGRQSFEQEIDEEDEDDFAGVPDRFAPLSERLPAPVYQQAQPTPFAPVQPQQPHFAPQPSLPQPFEERPAYPEPPRHDAPRHERQARPPRPPFRERMQERSIVDRGEGAAEGGGGEGGRGFGFNRNRDRERPRFQPRREGLPTMNEQASVAPDALLPVGLPAFITAPPAPRPAPGPVEAQAPATDAPAASEEHDAGVGFGRRRRRARPQSGEASESENAPVADELPLGE